VRRSHFGVAACVLALAAVVLAGCSGQASLQPPTTHGPPGFRFSVSFSQAPTVRTRQQPDAEGQALYGTSVSTQWTWTGGTTSVLVDALTNSVRPGRLPYLLRSYLPSGPSGRSFTKVGSPAMIGVVPGCDPSGKCSGFVGGLVILDGQTIYDLTTSQSTQSAVYAVLRTFRVIH
jgi:hypothetical protein